MKTIKRIVMIVVCMFALNSVNAQYFHLYKDGSLIKSYVAESIDSMLFDTSSSIYYMDLYNNGTKHRVGNLNRIDDFKIGGEPIKSGVYLGIVAFSSGLNIQPIGDLNSSTKSTYQNFVSSQTMRGSTHLYYAVENAIGMLKEAKLPEDLTSVSLVTFTDGLDDGSLDMTTKGFVTKDEYLNYLNEQITTTKISNLDINAYTIGFNGGYVIDMAQFEKNLKMLASKETNAKTVSNISDIENCFKEISDQIYTENHYATVIVTMNGKEHGEVIRITLDGVSDPTKSTKYIEGKFIRPQCSLSEVKYVGVTCESGNLVEYDTKVENTSLYRYVFEDVKANDGSEIKANNIAFWTYISSSGLWQDTNEGATGYDPEVEPLRKSAVVVFALDCSSSLDTQFNTLKSYANNFINTLAGYGNNKAFSAIDLRNETPETPEVPGTPSHFADFDIFSTLQKDEMIAIEGGTFTMGATSEQGSDYNSAELPTHQVTLSDYYIGKYEVTQQLWEYVMKYSGTCADGSTMSAYASDVWLGSNPSSSYGVGDYYPAYYVSWEDIVNIFIPRLNKITGKTFRLPTEAEWEYAARGGNKSKGYKYSGSNTIGDIAWYTSNSSSTTHPVGTKAPNELGIYDMSGNVWEWCSDWYSSSYYSSSPSTNPTGPSSGSYRVLRGGGWGGNARYCRVSSRNYVGNPDDRNYNDGFRLVLCP